MLPMGQAKDTEVSLHPGICPPGQLFWAEGGTCHLLILAVIVTQEGQLVPSSGECSSYRAQWSLVHGS